MAKKKNEIQLKLSLLDEGARKKLETFADSLKRGTSPLTRYYADDRSWRKQLGAGLSSLRRLERGMGQTSQKLAWRVGLPIIAAATASAKLSANFEKTMLRTKALTGATADQLERVKDRVIDVAAATKFSATQVGEGAQVLAQSGFGPEEIQSNISSVADFSAAAGVGVESGASMLADAASIFDLKNNMDPVARVMAKAANASNQTMSDLFEATRNVGPLASEMLQNSLEESFSALAALANFGRKGSTGGIVLRNFIARLATIDQRPGAAKVLRDRGLEGEDLFKISEDGSFKLKPLHEVLKKLSRLETQDFFEVFGMEIAGDVGKLVRNELKNNDETVSSLTKTLAKEQRVPLKETALDTLREADMAGLQGAFEGLKSNLEAFAIRFADKTGLSATVEKLMRNFSNLVGTLSKLDSVLISLAAAGAALVTGIGALSLSAAALRAFMAVVVSGPAMAGFLGPAAAAVGTLGAIGAVGATLWGDKLTGWGKFFAKIVPDFGADDYLALQNKPKNPLDIQILEGALRRNYVEREAKPQRVALDVKIEAPEGFNVSASPRTNPGDEKPRFSLNLGSQTPAWGL